MSILTNAHHKAEYMEDERFDRDELDWVVCKRAGFMSRRIPSHENEPDVVNFKPCLAALFMHWHN